MYWTVAQKGKINLCYSRSVPFVLSVDSWIVDKVRICHKRLVFLMHKEPFQIKKFTI